MTTASRRRSSQNSCGSTVNIAQVAAGTSSTATTSAVTSTAT
jgi:hypothetical protein